MRAVVSFTFIVSLGSACGSFSPQSTAITKAFFDDPDGSFKAIDTPAFSRDYGFTTHSELVAFLRRLVTDHSDMARLESLGSVARRSRNSSDLPKFDRDHRYAAQSVAAGWAAR